MDIRFCNRYVRRNPEVPSQFTLCTRFDLYINMTDDIKTFGLAKSGLFSNSQIGPLSLSSIGVVLYFIANIADP